MKRDELTPEEIQKQVADLKDQREGLHLKMQDMLDKYPEVKEFSQAQSLSRHLTNSICELVGRLPRQ